MHIKYLEGGISKYRALHQNHTDASNTKFYCHVCQLHSFFLLSFFLVSIPPLQFEETLSTNQSQGPLSAFEAKRRKELIRIIKRFTSGKDKHDFMTLNDQLEIVKAVYPFAHDTPLPPGWTETRLIMHIYTQIRQQRWHDWLRLPLAEADKKLETFIHQQQPPLLPYPTQLLALSHQLVVATNASDDLSDQQAELLMQHLPSKVALKNPYDLYCRFVQYLESSSETSVTDWLKENPFVKNLHTLFDL